MANRLANDLGAPAVSVPQPSPPSRVPPTQNRARVPSNGENLPARQAGRAVQRPAARNTPAGAAPANVDRMAVNVPPMASRAPMFEPAAVPPVRSRGRLIGLLLAVMFITMIAAFVIIYSVMKPQGRQQGSITFENFNKLPVEAQRRVQDSQNALFVSEKARQIALTDFQNKHPQIPAGFLGNPEDFGKNETRVKWTSGGTLIYSYVGSDRVLDADRTKAVLDAVVALDAEMIDAAKKNRQQIADVRASLERKIRELDELKLERNRAQAAMGQLPADEQLKALNSERAAAEKAWKNAVAARHAAETELQQLEEAGSPAGGTGTASIGNDATSTTSGTPTSSGDSQLDELQKRAENARKALDTALEQFQQSSSVVQRMLKDNPELSEFFKNNQKLQETAQKLSGDLLDRQQKTYEKWLEDKRYLDGRIAARRKELWDADVEMKRMKDDLGMLERQQGAAAGSGLTKEALEINKQLEARLAKIEQRKMELDHDPIVATFDEYAKKVQQEITDARKQLASDRKQAEAFARELEKNFSQLAPTVEKLPDSQRQAAQQMTSKLDAVNNARKIFAEALEAQGSDANSGLKGLEDTARLLAAKVDDRKKALLAINGQQLPAEERIARKAMIDKKRGAYAALKEQEKQAYDSYFTKEKAAGVAAEQTAAAEKARQDFDRLTPRVFALDGGENAEIKTTQRRLDQLLQSASADAYPSAPKMEEPLELEDRRFMAALGAGSGIFFVFSLLILTVGFRGSSPRDPYAVPFAAPVGEIEPLSGIGLRHPDVAGMFANGNGNGNGQSPADSHEESVVA